MFGKKKKWQQLQEAVRQDDAEQVKNIASNLTLYWQDGYYDACELAIQQNESEVLEALITAGLGLHFSRASSENRGLARKLLDAALSSSDPVPLLSVLYNKNDVTSPTPLTREDFLNKDTSISFIQNRLEYDKALFNDCVQNIGLFSTEKLEFILTFSSRSPHFQTPLDNALIQVAAAGDIEKAKLLLERKASPDYAQGRAVLRAAEGGHTDMVGLLLPLMNPVLCSDIATQLRLKDPSSSLIASLESVKRKTEAVIIPSAAPQETEEDYTLVDANTLAEVQQLPNGVTLTTLFNFKTRQQEKYAMNEAGDIFPSKPVNFNEIDKDVIGALREKFDALANPEPEPSQSQASTKGNAGKGYEHLKTVLKSS